MVPTNIGPSRSRNAGPLTSAIRCVMRVLREAAARSVKVNATIWFGSTPSSISEQTRREMASVLPAPAQAITWR